jgi:hypothetical protein
MKGVAVILALCLALACGRVVAPSPPPSEPDLFETVTVPGVAIALAAKSARTLQDLQYITRRFGSDSTWGFRSVDSFHVRVRYLRSSPDSTRLVGEYWGRCEDGGNSCLRGEFFLLVQGVAAEEVAPQ